MIKHNDSFYTLDFSFFGIVFLVILIFAIILGILYLIFRIKVWIKAYYIHCVKKKFLEFEEKDRERNRVYEEKNEDIDKNVSETTELPNQESKIKNEEE